MTGTPNDDQPGFVSEHPEHCFACYRPIRPGQVYYLTIEQEALCADCALDEGSIRVRDDLVVEVKRDQLLVQRAEAEVEVFPGEIRHLVNALVEAASGSHRGRPGAGSNPRESARRWIPGRPPTLPPRAGAAPAAARRRRWQRSARRAVPDRPRSRADRCRR